MFSVAIEPIKFSWTKIENIERNFFPDLIEQLKLPDRNSSRDISPMPAPAPVNPLQPFTPAKDHSCISNSDRSPQSKGHAQSPRN